jgi:class 3 adenylate cyclase
MTWAACGSGAVRRNKFCTTRSSFVTIAVTLGTIGFEGRFDYAAIHAVSNVASRLCDETKPGQILISPRFFVP